MQSTGWKGIDGVIVGMVDLSGTMGMLLELDKPEFKEKLDIIAEKCKKAGIPFGISLGSMDENMVRDWVQRGATFITVGGDQDFIKIGAVNTVKHINKILDEVKNY